MRARTTSLVSREFTLGLAWLSFFSMSWTIVRRGREKAVGREGRGEYIMFCIKCFILVPSKGLKSVWEGGEEMLRESYRVESLTL
jgi:hypothetical protein